LNAARAVAPRDKYGPDAGSPIKPENALAGLAPKENALPSEIEPGHPGLISESVNFFRLTTLS
jgi:hypothetical protein